LHTDASGQIPVSMGRKEFWLKIRDEVTGYSWDFFHVREVINNNNSEKGVKTVRYDNVKEKWYL
jgi:hypothetical protein